MSSKVKTLKNVKEAKKELQKGFIDDLILFIEKKEIQCQKHI